MKLLINIKLEKKNVKHRKMKMFLKDHWTMPKQAVLCAWVCKWRKVKNATTLEPVRDGLNILLSCENIKACRLFFLRETLQKLVKLVIKDYQTNLFQTLRYQHRVLNNHTLKQFYYYYSTFFLRNISLKAEKFRKKLKSTEIFCLRVKLDLHLMKERIFEKLFSLPSLFLSLICRDLLQFF